MLKAFLREITKSNRHRRTRPLKLHVISSNFVLSNRINSACSTVANLEFIAPCCAKQHAQKPRHYPTNYEILSTLQLLPYTPRQKTFCVKYNEETVYLFFRFSSPSPNSKFPYFKHECVL